MAQKQQLYVVVPVSYKNAAGAPVAEDWVLRVPDAFLSVDFAKLSPATLATFERVLIDPALLSDSCGIDFVPPTPTPNPGSEPGYSLTLPDLEPGGSYSYQITAANYVNLPAGSKPARVVKTGGSLPYLGLVNENAFPAQLAATVPTNAQAGTISLRTYLDPASAGFVDGTFAVGIKAMSVADFYGVLQTSQSNIIARIGGDSTASVSIKAVVFPSGFTQTSQYAMNHGNGDVIDALDRKKTYFTYVYNGPLAGRYVFEVKRGDLTRYVVCTYDPNRNSETLIITFQTAIPEPGDEIGALMVVVNSDRTVSLSVVASKQVQVTPPYPKGGTATAYVDMSKDGSTYKRTTAALTPGSYVGTYRLAGNATEYGYGFAIDKTTVLAIDRIDTDNGQTTELLAKVSFGDGVQFQQATYLDNGTLGDYTDWADMGSKVDTGGYQYTALGGYQSGKLYKKRFQFRPTTNPSAVVGVDVQQVNSNQGRRTVYPAGTAPASNDGNITETFTYNSVT